MIGELVPSDLEQVAALVRASFAPRLHDFMVYAQHGIAHFIGTQIAMPLAGPGKRFLVDTDDTKHVRAFAEFQEPVNGVAFLSYICVARDVRGSGLATRLIEHFLATTRSSALHLDVFAENHAAHTLYGKLGFEQTGRTGWYVRDLPAPSDALALRMTNAVEATAMFAYYGFCRHGVTWHGSETFLGRIGPRTIRCYSRLDFADDALLGAIRALFPDTRRAVFICSTDGEDLPDDVLLFQTSLRFVRNINASREN